jgi:hypothetical protein
VIFVRLYFCFDINRLETVNGRCEFNNVLVLLGNPQRLPTFEIFNLFLYTFVRNPSTGKVKKVNFGDKKMRIKKSNPKRRKSFRARHKCSSAKDRTSARYWSCRAW